jgi:hypothetical protein
LAQLAVDTGGRYTERTNDLMLGYARAQRDLACVYSLGIYVESIEDAPQGVSIRVRPSGLRAIHPAQYILRSDSKKKESLLRAAWIAPEMFQTGVVRAHLFPLKPASKKRWDGLLAIAFPVPLAQSGGKAVRRDFGAVLSRPLGAGGTKVIHRFNRRITLQPDSTETESKPTITFLQRVVIEPGRYEVAAVLNDPDVVTPHAASVEIAVPEIPRGDLFLVGPMLGRRSGPNLVVFGGGASPGFDELGEKNSFEPLLVQKLDRADDLIALTQACLVGSKSYRSKKGNVASIDRSLAREGGSEVGALRPEQLALAGEGKLSCQHLVDVLPAESISGGEYVFRAVLHGGRGEEVEEAIRFAIGVPAQGPVKE